MWNEQIPPAELDEFGTAGGRPSLRIPGPKGLGFGRTAVDSTGTVYIVGGSPYAPRLSEYRAGSTKPFQSITKGIGNVLGLDADSNDRLYVLDFGGPLVEYAAGATTPSAATYSGLCVNSSNAGPEALTVDRSGNVYVLATCGRPGQHSHAIFHSTTAD